MEYGKPVILLVSYDTLFVETLTPGRVTRTNLGEFPHDAMVGKPYGCRIYSTNDRGYIYTLRLTPSLWTRALSRQTQILFLPDISLIISKANVRPGSIVCEAGTGSGSLSSHFLAAVYPTGKLLTFDVEESRTQAVKESLSVVMADVPEQARSSVISAETRDVCMQGYPPSLEGGAASEQLADAAQPQRYADLVFLDIPEPEKAVGKAAQVLKPGAVLCVFCPCLEQVHRAIKACTELDCYVGFETSKMYSLAYELDTRRFGPLPLRKNTRKDSKTGKRAAGSAGGADKAGQQFPDTTSLPGLTPLPTTRLHTGYLMFSRYSGSVSAAGAQRDPSQNSILSAAKTSDIPSPAAPEPPRAES